MVDAVKLKPMDSFFVFKAYDQNHPKSAKNKAESDLFLVLPHEFRSRLVHFVKLDPVRCVAECWQDSDRSESCLSPAGAQETRNDAKLYNNKKWNSSNIEATRKR